MKNSVSSFVGRNRILLSFALVLVLVGGAVASTPSSNAPQKKRATITIKNRSDWDIHHLYLAPSDDTNWGPDQLGEDIIKSGGSYTLKNIPCDTYDIKVVDDDGDACIVEDVDLCKDATIWTITNKELARCQGWGE